MQETNTRMQRTLESHEACQRLAQLDGIGPLTATALVAAVREASTFKNGRECAAWLDVVPRPHATGGKPLLLGISSRDGRSRWLQDLIVRRGNNRAGVAQAHTTARIAWVFLAKGERYRPAACVRPRQQGC